MLQILLANYLRLVSLIDFFFGEIFSHSEWLLYWLVSLVQLRHITRFYVWCLFVLLQIFFITGIWNSLDILLFLVMGQSVRSGFCHESWQKPDLTDW